MPRRNLLILLLVLLLAVVCYPRVQQGPYARVLNSAMNTVERRALEPVTDKALFEGAMQGMLSQLDDYSVYITPQNRDKFYETIDQQFAGVGMEVGVDPETKQLRVLSPVFGSPAYQAGILAGDRILKIGKTNAQGMSLEDAVGLIRGTPGKPVTLTVQHAGSKEPVEMTIVRAIVHEPTVLGDTRNPDGSWNLFLEGHDRIGYLRINSFTDDTPAELKEAIEWLTARDVRGLVLDLRDDPGGYLTAAVDVCDLLVRSGVIVTTRRRGGQVSRSYTADGTAPFTDFPVAVVVNQDTASAAEIVAACLQDNHRAAVVGQRTYGKGTVQEVIDLPPDCGAMKFTTSSYWRPSGKDIQRPRDATDKQEWGVSPDQGCKVVLTPEEFDRWQLWRRKRDVFQPPEHDARHTGPAVSAPSSGTRRVPAASPGGAAEEETRPFVDVQRRRAVEYVETQAAGGGKSGSGGGG
jgi:carboxyl-terminal processing protease